MSELIIKGTTDEGVSFHASNADGDFDTLCGIDFNDPGIGHYGAETAPRGSKIDCPSCKNIIRHAKKYRKDQLA